MESFNSLIKVGILTIHLVDDDHTGHLCLFAHGHSLFGADNGTGNGGANDNCGIGESHCFIDFAIEIEEAGSVDDIDFGTVPLKGSDCGADRDVPLGLLGVIVGNG